MGRWVGGTPHKIEKKGDLLTHGAEVVPKASGRSSKIDRGVSRDQ